MSLYTAETKRLTKRRFTRFFSLGVVLVLIAIVAGMFFTNHKVTPERMAAAQVEADQQYQQAIKESAASKQQCLTSSPNPDVDCANWYEPQPSDFQAEWYMPSTFLFEEQFPLLVTALAAILAVAAFVIGATFVGAEWHSGGMMNLLLWRPRRLQVLSTKLGALLVALTAATVVLSAIFTAALALVADLRGTLDGMTSGTWQSFALMELRGLVVVLVAGAVGFGLASIGRHTAVAMGVIIGVVVVFQFGLGTILAIARVKFVEAYLIPAWISAWMDKKVELQDWDSCVPSPNGCEPATMTLHWPTAGALMATAVVVVVGLAMWTIRKRDIT